jgi:hypothetical protein
VSIETAGSGTGGGISQRGWIHLSGVGYCRFWEWNDNQGTDTDPKLQHCGDDAGGDRRFFKIEKLWIQAEHIYTYAIYDCGTSDWTTCTLDDAGPNSANFGNSIGTTDAEVHYGGANCTDDMLGSSNNQVQWGGTPAITGMLNVGGSWYVKPLDYLDLAGCGQYKSPTHTDDTFNVYDSNT